MWHGGAWLCVVLAACGGGFSALEATSIEKLTIKSEGGAICATPGTRTQLIVIATTKDGKKRRTAPGAKAEARLDPAAFKYKATVGKIIRKTGMFETPDEVLSLLAPVIVSAHHADSKDVTAERELEVRFDCDVSLEVRGEAEIRVGWLASQRAGRLAFVRVSDGERDGWYLLDPRGPGLVVDVQGDGGEAKLFAEDTEIASLIKVTLDGETTEPDLEIIASPTSELVTAAGGMPDEQAGSDDDSRGAADNTTTYEGTLTLTRSGKRGKPVVKTLELRGLLAPTDEGHRFELDAKCLIEMTAESKSKGFVFGAKCDAGGMRMVGLDGKYRIRKDGFELLLEGKVESGTVKMSFEGTP